MDGTPAFPAQGWQHNEVEQAPDAGLKVLSASEDCRSSARRLVGNSGESDLRAGNP